jgi:hypothetical protein
MAGKPEQEPMPVDSTAKRDGRGSDPYTEKMSLQNNGGSVSVTIPAAAVKVLGYNVGEKREVEVYDDGVFIPKEVADE